MSSAEVRLGVSLWSDWAKKYPIASLEDGMGEEDPDGWLALTKALGKPPTPNRARHGTMNRDKTCNSCYRFCPTRGGVMEESGFKPRPPEPEVVTG